MIEVLQQKAKAPNGYPPLLFCHGMNHAAWYWQENFFPWFTKKGFDCYALSYRNHGNSASNKNINFVSLQNYLEDIDSVASQFEERVILVGHSMGGLLVQMFLQQHKAKAAILLTPVPYNGIKSAATSRIIRNIAGLLMLIVKRSLKSFIDSPERASIVMYSKDLPGKKLNEYYKKIDEESIRAYLQMINIKVQLSDNHDIPMLVLAADNDRLLSTNSIKNTAAFYKADFEILTDMAHNAMLDTRWEQTAETINNWLLKNKATIC